jgi:hypothetical protein
MLQIASNPNPSLLRARLRTNGAAFPASLSCALRAPRADGIS